jgi:hypothetical protein
VSAWHPEATDLEALKKLWLMAQHDNGGARVCARLLLGLYNGRRFPFDLTDLRLLDDQYLEAALTVLRMDARPAMEVHELLQRTYGWRGMGARFELMACDWNIKGRCSKQQERDQRAWLAKLETETQQQGAQPLRAVQ